jgi:hypothetical protein
LLGLLHTKEAGDANVVRPTTWCNHPIHKNGRQPNSELVFLRNHILTVRDVGLPNAVA